MIELRGPPRAGCGAFTLRDMTPVLAIVAAALAADPPRRPLVVREATDTRLALEIQPMPIIADGRDAALPPIRTVVFTRSAAGAAWSLASGLVDAEVVGEPNLTFPLDAGTVRIAAIDAAIDATAGTGVTVIDLIEGDVALCVWHEGAVRSIFFADELIPKAAALPRGGGARNPLLPLSATNRPDGAPAVRGAIIAAQSRTAAVASFGRMRATAATTVSQGVVAKADLETCSAVLDYAQPGVEPKIDSQYELYRGLARLLESSGRASPASD